MPTIILNKATTNPNIPMVPVRGFFDDFERADAPTLGRTSRENKAWDTLGGKSMLSIVGGAASLEQGATDPTGLHVVDALATNGTLRAVWTRLEADAGIRLAFRVQDARNFWVCRVANGTVDLRKYIDLTLGVVVNPVPAPVGPKTVEAVLHGSNIRIVVNGATLINVNDAALSAATMHGFQAITLAAGAAPVRVSEIGFSPA